MLPRFVYKNIYLSIKFRNVVNHSSQTTNTTSNYQLQHLLQNNPLSIRFISNTPNSNQFTIDYLRKSCGLSSESAHKASKFIVLKSTERPDSVLSLFKTYGFTDSQISKLIYLRPKLLLTNPDVCLRPKLEYFCSFGILGTNLGRLACSDAHFLAASLEKIIIPAINYLKSVVHTDDAVAYVLNRSTWFISSRISIQQNISILRKHQVPEENILKFITQIRCPVTMDSEEFNKKVLELKEMGVCHLSLRFVRCLHVLTAIKKPLWDEKLAIFRRFGWSEDEVMSVFKKEPNMLASSTKKISSSLDFFMNNLKWTPVDISKNPVILRLRMETRIRPRWAVLQKLLSKDLIRKDAIRKAFVLTEPEFLKRFVAKYQYEVSELLELYQRKIRS